MLQGSSRHRRRRGSGEPGWSVQGAVRAWEPSKEGGVRVFLATAVVEVSIATDGCVRVRAAAGETLPPDPLPALGRAPWDHAPAEPRSTREAGLLLTSEGRRGSARVEIETEPFCVRVADRTGARVASIDRLAFQRDGRARVELASAEGERVSGLGELPGRLDRRGSRARLRNVDTQAGRIADATYLAVPFLLLHASEAARDAHPSRGVLLDALGPSRFDLAASHSERLRLESDAGGIDLTVFPGPRPRDVLARFTARVGRQPLPPRWALGHHQSRWSYRSEAEVRALATEIRRRRIPTDAIHLDIDHMHGYRVFTWHPRRFSDPERLLRDLRRQGFRVVVIVDPCVKEDPDYGVFREGLERGFFCRNEDGSLFSQYVWPGRSALPDFNRADVRAWWAEQHRPLVASGVAGIWNDMNEPAGWKRELRLFGTPVPIAAQDTSRMRQSHPVDGARSDPGPGDGARTVSHESVRNVYGLQECRATRQGLEAGDPGRRHFVLSRSGYAGIQRYAAVWTGDNWSRWRDLRASLPTLLNLSLSGVAFCGPDIGGFAGNCTPELYARWIQIGALYPFARTHSMWLKRRQEPWRFGPRVEEIAREALRLRMRLLPYLVGLFHACEGTGAPVWRPLWFEFPDDAEAGACEDQVMVGPALLAAPVLERSAREREVYLPAGVWHEWEGGARYVGPRRVRVSAPLERMPLFARGGAVVPMQSAVEHVDEIPREPLVLEAFPGADGESWLLEEDGETTAYRDASLGGRGELARTRLRLRDRAGGRLRLELGAREGAYPIEERPLRVVLRGCGSPRGVFADGDRLAAGDAAPGYRVVEGDVHVLLDDRGTSRSVEVEPAP